MTAQHLLSFFPRCYHIKQFTGEEDDTTATIKQQFFVITICVGLERFMVKAELMCTEVHRSKLTCSPATAQQCNLPIFKFLPN